MSEPHFNARELDFLKSLPLPKSGLLMQVNCGAGEVLSQFHALYPGLDLEGIEPSAALREAFAQSSDSSFSACLWKEEYQEEAGSYDVICLSQKEACDLRKVSRLRKELDHYWPLLSEGGCLLIEVSFVDDTSSPPLDWEADRVPWLEKNLQLIDLGRMLINWFPVPEKERGILALQKGGLR